MYLLTDVGYATAGIIATQEIRQKLAANPKSGYDNLMSDIQFDSLMDEMNEEEEALIACEKWRSRKQKLDETVDEYHTVFVSNADKAGIIVDKELLRQWGRNVLPQARVAVQTARFSNPALTFQSGVRIAQDVQAALGGDEPATAYKRDIHEDMDEELVNAKRVRAIAATAAEGVMKGMETEMANVKRELLKAQEQVKVMEAREEKRMSLRTKCKVVFKLFTSFSIL